MLTLYKDLGNEFVTAANQAVTEFVANAFATGHRGNIDGYVDEMVVVEPKIGLFVHYSEEFVQTTYKNLPPELLPDVINAHMHNNWLGRFPDGIQIIDPITETDRILHYPALATAYALTICPPEELEQLCPPGKTTCYKCNSNLPSGFIKTTRTISDSPRSFKFITIPHPLTHLALSYGTVSQLTPDFVRRMTARDEIVKAITADIVEDGVGAPDRLLELKKRAAANYDVLDTEYYSIWDSQFELSPACALDNYFEWALGFSFGGVMTNDAPPNRKTNTLAATSDRASPFSVLSLQLEQCLPASEVKQLHKDAETIVELKAGVKPPLQKTEEIINAARGDVQGTGVDTKRKRKMVEGWNMADAELWRFVRALNERISQEPAVWLQ